MKKTVKKLYRGKVEIRDYDVRRCIDDNKHFEIVYLKESMILSPEELISKRKSISNTFKSKVGGKDYKLYAYEWDPNN
jgi:hypothetical protein|tara:strand:- start:37 stop:270 length:234 start_codon:yes stop_codon:yes gene_type:complete